METVKTMDSKTKNQFYNAFSNGVVPQGIDRSWLIGRQSVIDGFDYMLNQAADYGLSSFKLIEGPYGSGKSMVLSVLEKEAIAGGFIVARLSLGTHNNFSKPELIYKDIMSSLKVKIGPELHDFEEIFDSWLKQKKSGSDQTKASKEIFYVINELQKYHPSFAAVLLVYIRARINNEIELKNIAAGWMKGDYNISYEKKKQLNIKGSIDRNNAFDILKGFSKLVTLLGFNGLVIMVDELEYILRERVDIRNKSYTTMRGLIDEIGENKWVNTVFIGAQTPDMMVDADKGYQSYEALYQRINDGFEHGGLIKDYKHMTILPLDGLSDDELLVIGEKVAELKESDVHSHLLANLALVEYRKKTIKNTKDSVVRGYIKLIVQMIQMSIDNPEMPIFKVNQP